MRMKIKKWLAAFTVAAGMVLPATTAFAFTDEAAQQAVEAPAPTETPVQEEEPPKTEETPFSVPGNGSLADDKSGDSTKEFLTVQTKNGNTFFLVLDRSSNKENVYMLSMIDEDDLAEFVTETKKQETEQPTVITPQPETKPAVEETEKEPEKARRLADFLTVASLIERQIYPVNAKYFHKTIHNFRSLQTRTKDPALLNATGRLEVDQLIRLTEDMKKYLGICQNEKLCD